MRPELKEKLRQAGVDVTGISDTPMDIEGRIAEAAKEGVDMSWLRDRAQTRQLQNIPSVES